MVFYETMQRELNGRLIYVIIALLDLRGENSCRISSLYRLLATPAHLVPGHL
jgi:hypothetical protein